jgi:hypothetical protein
MANRHLETSLNRIRHSLFLRLIECSLWFLRAIRLLKTSSKSLFSNGGDAENDFALHFDTLKHHFIDFNKVVFFFLRSEGRLWVLRAIRLLRTSLKRLHPSHIFRFPWCRKWVRLTHRHLETSLHRLRQRRFLRRPEGRLWVLRSIHLLKTTRKRLRHSRFYRSKGCRKCVLMAFRHFETSLHRLHQSRFLRRPEGRLWVLRVIRLLKTWLKGLRPNLFFNARNVESDFAWHFDTLKHRFFDHQISILWPSEGRFEFSWSFA